MLGHTQVSFFKRSFSTKPDAPIAVSAQNSSMKFVSFNFLLISVFVLSILFQIPSIMKKGSEIIEELKNANLNALHFCMQNIPTFSSQIRSNKLINMFYTLKY